MSELASVLQEAGGARAAPQHTARIRALLAAALTRSEAELRLRRSGYEECVVVAFAALPAGVGAVVPVPVEIRADQTAAPERAWLLVAATVGALVHAGCDAAALLAGAWERWLCLQAPDVHDAGAVARAFAEQVAPVDRLRVEAHIVPATVLAGTEDLRRPPGRDQPLLVAGRVAQLGGRPASPASVADLEDALIAMSEHQVARPHDDPDPARRVARRILQRLAGMGKWGGYHTEFSHLYRGFPGHERAFAEAVGEALVADGMLREKKSVGQRHVYLDPHRAADIYALIDDCVTPASLRLPEPP